MAIKDALLPEFEHEMANTRKMLERVPFTNPDWQPHPKSAKLLGLATHLAMLPTWMKNTLEHDALDLAGFTAPPERPASVEALLQRFDANVAEAKVALAGATDAQMMQPWSLKNGDHVFFTMPKVAVLRSFVFSHTIHHRAQLGVFLRLLNVPIPGMYGPSADEKAMM